MFAVNINKFLNAVMFKFATTETYYINLDGLI